jgi:hypothetical protein
MTDNAFGPVGTLDEMSLAECLAFLGGTHVGRVAVVHDGYPLVVPVNYRLLQRATGGPVVVIRVRPGGIIDLAGAPAALQIDGIDEAVGVGWAVLVRGAMHHVDASALEDVPWADPHPWLADRDQWVVIDPIAISGRRVIAGDVGWGFHPLGYL